MDIDYPILSANEEANLSRTERERRNTLVEQINELHDIGTRIDHFVLVGSINRAQFSVLSDGKEFEDPTLTQADRQRALQFALNIANHREGMVENLVRALESPFLESAIKSAIALSLVRLIHFP